MTYNIQQEVTKRTLCHQLVTSVWSALAFIEAWRLFSCKIQIFHFLFFLSSFFFAATAAKNAFE